MIVVIITCYVVAVACFMIGYLDQNNELIPIALTSLFIGCALLLVHDYAHSDRVSVYIEGKGVEYEVEFDPISGEVIFLDLEDYE